MREMDRRVGLLRLLLADITDRERLANEAHRQLRGQLQRIVDFTIQYNGGVANALASMLEVEERLTQQEATLRHLGMLRERARGELNALLVTRDIATARARLTELEAQRAQLLAAQEGRTSSDQPTNSGADAVTTPPLPEIDAEIASLRAAIEEASDAAARSLTNRPPDRPQ
jgi:chromosome segregation ATPase